MRRSLNHGFTYMDVLIAIGIISIFIGIFAELSQFEFRQRRQSDEINKMNMIAQGVMDSYRILGKDAALANNQGYNVSLVEDSNTDYATLKKVTITVAPKIAGINSIILVSYNSN